MPAEPSLHGLKSEQVYVIFQALLAGKSHPLYEPANKMAKQYCDKYEEAILKPSVMGSTKRMSAA